MARGRPSKKQLILDTARKLFAQTGYQGTSIDLVVKQAAVSKPTVYNNFPTKQALLRALMEALLIEAEAFRNALWQDSKLSPSDGIIEVFEHIANTPEFLAVYRISYGERHKLEKDTYQLFKQFDATLITDYQRMLAQQNVTLSETGFISVMGICREGILIPALSGSTAANRSLVKQAVAAQFDQQ